MRVVRSGVRVIAACRPNDFDTRKQEHREKETREPHAISLEVTPLRAR